MASEHAKKWNVAFVLGPPGSGKGTQCTYIAKEFGFVHLSAGDLLRKEQTRAGSEFGQLINAHIVAGTIVPVEVTCKLIEDVRAGVVCVGRATRKRVQAMAANASAPGFLVDGFPRNKNNFDGWIRAMGDKTRLLFVLFLHCSQQTCVRRCLSRGQNRADDNDDSLKRRIDTYFTQTKPIIEHYEQIGVVRQVDAEGTPDHVFAQISKHFQNDSSSP